MTGPRILRVDPYAFDYPLLRPVVDLLLNGGVAAGPTQTFYALIAAADQPEALTRIQTLKARDRNKPLMLLLDRRERVLCYARELPECVEGLIGAFWPGPLTILLRALTNLHPALVGPTNTVGVRVEGLPVIRALVRALDRAITGTSANPGGEAPACTAREVVRYFGDRVDLVLDGGPCPGNLPTTLIDAELGPPRLLRDGILRLDDLVRIAPDLRT